MSSSDTVIANQIQTVVNWLLPGRSQPRVADLTRITDGWECDVFSFVLESHGDTLSIREALILRVYQGQGAVRKAVAEFDGMRRLRVVGYPVPAVHALVVDDSPLDGPFVIMEKIEGPTLGTMLEVESGDARARSFAASAKSLSIYTLLTGGRSFLTHPRSRLPSQSTPGYPRSRRGSPHWHFAILTQRWPGSRNEAPTFAPLTLPRFTRTFIPGTSCSTGPETSS